MFNSTYTRTQINGFSCLSKMCWSHGTHIIAHTQYDISAGQKSHVIYSFRE